MTQCKGRWLRRHRFGRWTQVEREESNQAIIGLYRTTRTINQRRCEVCGFVQERKADG